MNKEEIVKYALQKAFYSLQISVPVALSAAYQEDMKVRHKEAIRAVQEAIDAMDEEEEE